MQHDIINVGTLFGLINHHILFDMLVVLQKIYGNIVTIVMTMTLTLIRHYRYRHNDYLLMMDIKEQVNHHNYIIIQLVKIIIITYSSYPIVDGILLKHIQYGSLIG